MKKVLSILVVIAMSICASAQGHLKFKGVEITGQVKTFSANLEKRGCRSGETWFGLFNIKADFAGLDMMVYPLTTSQTQTVYAVVACTRDIEEAVSLNAQYDELKKLLTQKYGEGKETAIADGYYRNLVDDLKRGNVNKPLLFEAENGQIYLYIHKSESYGKAGSVNIQYIDKINEQLKRNEANIDI